MTDWELQDFAVQIVRDHLEKAGRKLMSWQGNPSVDPSIWFVGDEGPEWVVVRAARYPKANTVPPENWQQIADRCARIARIGHFASVSVANADDAFDSSVPLRRFGEVTACTYVLSGLRPGRQPSVQTGERDRS